MVSGWLEATAELLRTDKTWQVASLRDIAHVSSAAFAYQSPVKCETIAGPKPIRRSQIKRLFAGA